MNKNDLRYVKTEANLRNSLLDLLNEKSYEMITIKEICERALCSRNTFYLHYDTKDDLYNTIIKDIFNNLSMAFIPHVTHAKKINSNHYIAYTNAIIDSVIVNKKSLRIFINSDTGVFFKQFRETIEEIVLVYSKMISRQGDSDVNKLFTAYLSASITGFIFEWIKNENVTDNEAKEILHQIHLGTMTTINNNLVN